MRNRRIVAVCLAAILLGAVFWLFVLPSVDYYLNPNCIYQKQGDSWATVINNGGSSPGTVMQLTCKNNGLLWVTVEIVVTFSGANFSTDTPTPFERISDASAKFVFNLGSFEQKSANIYFNITDSESFTISLSLMNNPLFSRVVDPLKHPNLPSIDYSYRELNFERFGDTFYPGLIS